MILLQLFCYFVCVLVCGLVSNRASNVWGMRVSDMARYAQYLRVLRLFYPPPRHTNTKTYFTRMSRAFPAKKDLIPQEFQIFRFFGPTRRGIGHPIPYRSPRPRWPRQGGSRRTFFKSEPRGGVVWWFRGLDVDVLTLLQDEK